MNVQVIEATHRYKEVIRNLLQYYIYDFSEFAGYDVEQDGRYFAYPSLEEYWNDTNKFPYIIKKDDNYAGFVFVSCWTSPGVKSLVPELSLLSSKDSSQKHFSIKEFFVMRKYRGKGVGKMVAMQIFDIHKGNWEVYQTKQNKSAHSFWKKVIAEYTDGRFTEHSEKGKTIQHFQSQGNY